MAGLVTMLLAALPSIFFSIISKVLSKTVLQAVMEKVICEAITKAAAMTTNVVDDEIAALVCEAIKTKPEDVQK